MAAQAGATRTRGKELRVSELRIRPTAGVVLRGEDGRVLVLRRRDDATWGIPGGGLEPGESWAEAALRECLEETGWRARIHELLGIYSHPSSQVHRYPSGVQRHFVGVVFLATAVERLAPHDDEATELRWVTSEELPAPLFAPDAPVLRDAFDPDIRRPVIG
jgi:8-oxo-dGTP pyrophosphatase MutT (NUDIX family)